MIIRRFRKKKRKRKSDEEDEYIHEEERMPEGYYPDIRPDEKAVEIYYSYLFGDDE